MTPTDRDRLLYWILGVALVVSYAYFYQGGGWNQNSRFALVRAITERDTLQIDEYRGTTGDRAVWKGHFYSDKAPGVSLLALVPVDIVRALNSAMNVAHDSDEAITRTSYLATVLVSGLSTTVAALCVLWLSLSWGYSRGAALFAATAYAVASPAWCYATLFMGHALCAGCLMVALTAGVALRDASPARSRALAWVVGLAAGWAVVSEFPAAVPVLFVCGLVFATMKAAGRTGTETRAVALRVAAGGAIAGAVLLAYNAAAFGSPLHLGYASEEGFEQLHTGLFGISWPEWWRVREILIGAYRGILPIAPLVAVMPVGLVVLGNDPRTGWPARVAGATAIFYLALNASYFYWEGGWAFGPRHLVPALPLLALGLAPLWDRWAGWGRVALGILWAWGAAVTLVAVSTTPQPPAAIARPVTELMIPAFREGHLALNTQRFTDMRADEAAIARHAPPSASWNLGMIMGLTGLASLIPLALVWATAGGVLIPLVRVTTPSSAAPVRDGGLG
jgi:hypothetical protein